MLTSWTVVTHGKVRRIARVQIGKTVGAVLYGTSDSGTTRPHNLCVMTPIVEVCQIRTVLSVQSGKVVYLVVVPFIRDHSRNLRGWGTGGYVLAIPTTSVGGIVMEVACGSELSRRGGQRVTPENSWRITWGAGVRAMYIVLCENDSRGDAARAGSLTCTRDRGRHAGGRG